MSVIIHSNGISWRSWLTLERKLKESSKKPFIRWLVLWMNLEWALGLIIYNLNFMRDNAARRWKTKRIENNSIKSNKLFHLIWINICQRQHIHVQIIENLSHMYHVVYHIVGWKCSMKMAKPVVEDIAYAFDLNVIFSRISI